MKSGLPELFNRALENQRLDRPVALLIPPRPYMIASPLATSILRDGMVALLRKDAQPPRVGHSGLKRGGINGRGQFDVLTQEGTSYMLNGPQLDYTLTTEGGVVEVRLRSSAYPRIGLPADSLFFVMRVKGVGERLEINPEAPNNALVFCETGLFSDHFHPQEIRPFGTKDARMYLEVLNRLTEPGITSSQGVYAAARLNEPDSLPKGGSMINA